MPPPTSSWPAAQRRRRPPSPRTLLREPWLLHRPRSQRLRARSPRQSRWPSPPPTGVGWARPGACLSGYLGSVRSRGKIDASTWDELEEALIRADVGVGATDGLLEDLRGRVKDGEIGGPDALVDALKADLVAMLSTTDARLAVPAERTAPHRARTGRPPSRESADGRSVDVWLFVGVNGVGKTTTVGKVANRLSASGTKVLAGGGRHLPGRRRRTVGHVGFPGRRRHRPRGRRAATRARWCSTPSSGPRPRGTPWSWPTRPAACTTRSI